MRLSRFIVAIPSLVAAAIAIFYGTKLIHYMIALANLAGALLLVYCLRR